MSQGKLKHIRKTKSTFVIDLPDKIRQECALDLTEPVANIINSCLKDGRFPALCKREWVTPVPNVKPGERIKTCNDVRKVASTSDYAKCFKAFL